MWEWIYRFTMWVARIHDHILGINDSGGWYFDDKQLHFIVFGLFGMALIFVLHPIFKLLAESGHTMIITWLFAFSAVIVVSFAVEIGQWYSGTGSMDSEDIAYGIRGFLFMFIIFAIIRAICLAVCRAIKRKDDRKTKAYSRDMFDQK